MLTITQTIEAEAICNRCHQPMHDGDVVVMDWAGEATEHVNCETITKERN